MIKPRFSTFVLFCLSTLCVVGCANLNDPYSGGYGGGYGGGYNPPPPPPAYGGYYGSPGYYNNNPYGNGNYDSRERRELERERARLEEERRRLEKERDRPNYSYPQPTTRPTYQRPVQESCPSGFSPSEQKCSPEERRRGCRDMRLPGGLGCVSR